MYPLSAHAIVVPYPSDSNFKEVLFVCLNYTYIT